MLNSYSHSTTFLKRKKLNKYKKSLDEYFNFIWESNKGIMEHQATAGLPASLKAEIFLFRYSEVLANSEVLKADNTLNTALVRSLCGFMKFNYYLFGEVILRVDDSVTDIFFILMT